MSIGEEAKPPFVVLPDPATVFLGRAKRLEALAPGSKIAPFLQLAARICRAQSSIQADLPPVGLPVREPRLAEHGMPPLQYDLVDVDVPCEQTFRALAEALTGTEAPGPFRAAVTAVTTAPPETRRLLLQSALHGETGSDEVALHSLALASLQVHFVRLAALLDAAAIAPAADGVCPVCASRPAASAVVGWPQANNTRFCTCGLCGTQWHVVRLKCTICGTTGGITYRSIEGRPETLRAECCDACKAYVKIVYQVKDPALDPIADDIASLDLDMKMAEDGWKRGGSNPFLLGY
jgi:FdhE protein